MGLKQTKHLNIFIDILNCNQFSLKKLIDNERSFISQILRRWTSDFRLPTCFQITNNTKSNFSQLYSSDVSVGGYNNAEKAISE